MKTVEQKPSFFLENLAEEQKAESQALRLAYPSFWSPSQMLEAYRGSQTFKQIYAEATNFYCGFHAGDELSDHKSVLAARVFQDIGFIYLINSSITNPTIHLSYNRTSRLFRDLYPRNEVKKVWFSLDGLKGISVPDAIGIRDGEVKEVIEFSLQSRESYYDRKIMAYEGRVRHQPEIFGNSILRFIIPEGSLPHTLSSKNAIFDQVPIDRFQIGNFINNFYVNPPDSELASLVDVRRNAVRNAKRNGEADLIEGFVSYLQRVNGNGVTPAYWNRDLPITLFPK